MKRSHSQLHLVCFFLRFALRSRLNQSMIASAALASSMSESEKLPTSLCTILIWIFSGIGMVVILYLSASNDPKPSALRISLSCTLSHCAILVKRDCKLLDSLERDAMIWFTLWCAIFHFPLPLRYDQVLVLDSYRRSWLDLIMMHYGCFCHDYQSFFWSFRRYCELQKHLRLWLFHSW